MPAPVAAWPARPLARMKPGTSRLAPGVALPTTVLEPLSKMLESMNVAQGVPVDWHFWRKFPVLAAPGPLLLLEALAAPDVSWLFRLALTVSLRLDVSTKSLTLLPDS